MQLSDHRRDMARAGRLTCCVCGCDLGNIDDPYRDPDCACCHRVELAAELGMDEPACPTLQMLAEVARG